MIFRLKRRDIYKRKSANGKRESGTWRRKELMRSVDTQEAYLFIYVLLERQESTASL